MVNDIQDAFLIEQQDFWIPEIEEVASDSRTRGMGISREAIQKAIGLNTITPEQAEKFRDALSKICDFFEPENEEDLVILAEKITRRLIKKLKPKKGERFYCGCTGFPARTKSFSLNEIKRWRC